MSITTPASSLRWQIALKAVEAATNKASELNILINVAVVDQAGISLAFARMNGSFLHSADIASDKAYTAAWSKALVSAALAYQVVPKRRMKSVPRPDWRLFLFRLEALVGKKLKVDPGGKTVSA